MSQEVIPTPSNSSSQESDDAEYVEALPVRPPRTQIEWIKKNGTKEQKAQLEWILRVTETPKEKEARENFEAYSKRVDAPKKKADEFTRLDEAKARMFRQMNKISSRHAQVIASEVYPAAKKLIWEAFRTMVKRTSHDPEAEPIMSEAVIMAMHQVTHWLACDTECNCEKNPLPKDKLVPLTKSLYIYGPAGTGKTTLAWAMHFASIQLHGLYNTGLRLKIDSINDALIKINTSGSMKQLSKFHEGAWILDELTEEAAELRFYGNKLRIAYDLLLLRHNVQQKTGAPTVITSNLEPAELQEMLSDQADRMSDRLVYEYFPIKIGGSSFRRKTTGHGK